MKKQRILFSLALMFSLMSSAPAYALCDSIPHAPKHAYDAWLKSRAPKEKLFGKLRGVNDSTLFFETRQAFDVWEKQQGWLVVPVSSIENISFRRKNSSGVGIGVVLGLAALGSTAGVMTAKHPEEVGTVLITRVLAGLTTGILLGMVIGFRKKKRTINGDQKKYLKNRAYLQKFIQ